MKAKITSIQLKRLWVSVSELEKRGLDREEAESVLRDIVESVSGQKSTKVLSSSQADDVWKELRARLDGRQEAAPELTSAQRRAIFALRGTLKLGEAGYTSLCCKTIGNAYPVSRADGMKLYEALEAILRRRWPSPMLSSMLERLLATPSLSSADASYVRSLPKDGLSAGQLGILLRIGGRYGIVPEARRGGEAPGTESTDGPTSGA